MQIIPLNLDSVLLFPHNVSSMNVTMVTVEDLRNYSSFAVLFNSMYSLLRIRIVCAFDLNTGKGKLDLSFVGNLK